MTSKLRSLIDLVMDEKASIADRDDAAMDLSAIPSKNSLDALVAVAKNAKENPLLLASCGESIAEILVEMNEDNPELINDLALPAKREAVSFIASKRPFWMSGKIS